MFIIPTPWEHDSGGFYCPPRGESTQGIDPLPLSPLTWGARGMRPGPGAPLRPPLTCADSWAQPRLVRLSHPSLSSRPLICSKGCRYPPCQSGPSCHRRPLLSQILRRQRRPRGPPMTCSSPQYAMTFRTENEQNQ